MRRLLGKSFLFLEGSVGSDEPAQTAFSISSDPLSCSMHSYPALGACPFCNQPFKSAGRLTNHMEKVYPNLQGLPRKWKYVNRASSQEEPDSRQELVRTTECITHQDLEQWLMELLSDSGIFSSQRNNCDELLWGLCEEIIFDRGEDNRDSNPQDSLSDANECREDGTISFSPECEAGKIIAAYDFVRQRDPIYNFFRPFQNALDFKLARFFYSAHVPKVRIDEFFKDSILAAKTDAEESPLAPILPTRFSFHSAYGLY